MVRVAGNIEHDARETALRLNMVGAALSGGPSVESCNLCIACVFDLKLVLRVLACGPALVAEVIEEVVLVNIDITAEHAWLRLSDTSLILFKWAYVVTTSDAGGTIE